MKRDEKAYWLVSDTIDEFINPMNELAKGNDFRTKEYEKIMDNLRHLTLDYQKLIYRQRAKIQHYEALIKEIEKICIGKYLIQKALKRLRL